MSKIKRAVISVSDKTGIVGLGKDLTAMGVEILSTGGTARTFKEAEVPVLEVSEYTGFPEMLDGRVKTLHPKIHAGLLARRDQKSHMEQLKAHDISPIDLLVVNLYPFERIITSPEAGFNDAVENIDIGGPAMLRAAAKNFQSVVVVVDPADYQVVLDDMRGLNGDVSYKTRAKLCRKAFEHTARYDTLIADYFREVSESAPEIADTITISARKAASLRYGENPHQKAALYVETGSGLSMAKAERLLGPDPSFNNMLDADTAILILKDLKKGGLKAAVLVKHYNPCGAALSADLSDACKKALSTDRESAFGGVCALGSEVNADVAKQLIAKNVDMVVATSYNQDAMTLFAKKPSIRIYAYPDLFEEHPRGWDFKRVSGGLLIQQRDDADVEMSQMRVVSKQKPSDEQLRAMELAWKVVKYSNSNAVVYALADRTLGMGIGQSTRMAAAKIGAMNAVEPLRGASMAADGFLPFRDAIDAVNHLGIKAVIQPGGSKNDEEIIRAADEHEMVMVFTGVRRFRH